MATEWNQDEIVTKLNNLLDGVVKLAMEDDVISEDEQELIDVMRNHLHGFDDQLSMLIEEHSTIDEVIVQTKNAFERAIEATARQARKDGTITSDELILIDRLAKSLRRENLSKYFS